jgi:hypothetical protein
MGAVGDAWQENADVVGVPIADTLESVLARYLQSRLFKFQATLPRLDTSR